jgi:hypothetical protein
MRRHVLPAPNPIDVRRAGETADPSTLSELISIRRPPHASRRRSERKARREYPRPPVAVLEFAAESSMTFLRRSAERRNTPSKPIASRSACVGRAAIELWSRSRLNTAASRSTIRRRNAACTASGKLPSTLRRRISLERSGSLRNRRSISSSAYLPSILSERVIHLSTGYE